MASQAVWGTSCLARLVFAPRPERNARNSKPRNLAAFWLLQCYTVKEGLVRGFARGSFGRQSSSFGRTGREQNGNQGPLENTTPLYGGRGGGFVGFRSVVSCFVHLSASMESDMRELNSGSIAWRPRHSLTAAALRMEFHFHGGGAAPVLPNL